MAKKNNKFISWVLIGVGLIVLGLVTTGVIFKGNLLSDYSVTPVAVNFPAPDFALNNLDGERVSISDFPQNIVLINNWATWCPPCRAEMPTLLKYFKDHHEDGFMLIGINAGDPKAEVVKFVDEYNLTFPILLDPNNQSLIVFDNDSLPSSYVIDRHGNVVLAWTGPINLPMLEKYITPLLEE
jgi:peroxiredoxin